jgi:alkanesulfonate monooxygenase SsuD/methylene tetrahydromethanopterin reductase-like flavin-dependent oxidoreductase (luciferase family)
VELGIYTFGELTPDAASGTTISPAERLRNLLEEIELADRVGLDVFGVGEHHRPDFTVPRRRRRPPMPRSRRSCSR